MSILNLEVIEWSPSQECFHWHTVKEMLRDNLLVFKDRTGGDFLPIGVFRTREEAQAFLDKAYQYLGVPGPSPRRVDGG